MRCPFCAALDDRVIDSRSSTDGHVIRRRRQCQKCERRFTTYERVEETPRLVLKKDMRREVFSRQKILQGLLKACEKRPVSAARLEEVVDLVERRVDELPSPEVESGFVGEILADELRKIDQVAYVRFASVYREFADVSEFLQELAPLVEEHEPGTDSESTEPPDAAASPGGPRPGKFGLAEDADEEAEPSELASRVEQAVDTNGAGRQVSPEGLRRRETGSL